MKLVRILVVEIPTLEKFNEKYGAIATNVQELENLLHYEWSELELTEEFGSLTNIFKLID